MKKPLLFFFAIITIIGSIWILQSNGFYFIDECARFLYSRFVLQALPITVQTWHRPIPQWLFALPAQLGHIFTMFFALALFLILLLVTYKIAVLKGMKHAEWVVLLTGLQPILFDLSYACMNEVPAAILIVLSYWYHLKERHGLSLTIASLVIMCRPEMYVFAGLMFLVSMWKRKWKLLPIVLLGPTLWIVSTTMISGNIMTFFTEWSKYSSLGRYVPGVSLLYYLENLHVIFGVAQLLLFIAGIIFIARAKKSADFGIIYVTITIAIILNTLAGAEIFHWTGSVGDLRYITVVGPFFAIVSVYGFSAILERVKSSNFRFAFSLLVFSVVIFNCTLATHPRRWANYEKVLIDMTNAARKEYPDLTLLSNNAVVPYVMDVAPSGGLHYAVLNRDMITKYPECLILWDPFAANSIYVQMELTKGEMLQDTTIMVLERYRYWESEYLLLYRDSHGIMARKDSFRKR
jgi:hypothetical protein